MEKQNKETKLWAFGLLGVILLAILFFIWKTGNAVGKYVNTLFYPDYAKLSKADKEAADHNTTSYAILGLITIGLVCAAASTALPIIGVLFLGIAAGFIWMAIARQINGGLFKEILVRPSNTKITNGSEK